MIHHYSYVINIHNLILLITFELQINFGIDFYNLYYDNMIITVLNKIFSYNLNGRR